MSLWIYILIAIVSTYLSWQISFSLSIGNYIPKENISNILKSLLDSEIALIGFWAIILVFVFNNLRETKEHVSSNKHELEVKRDQQLITFEPDTIDMLKPMWEKTKARIDDLDAEFRQLVVQTFVTSITAVGTVVLLLLSIFHTIYSIGLIADNGLHYMRLFLCLLPLFMAFMVIFTVTIFSLPKREHEILTQELRKRWEKAKAILRDP